MSDLMQEGNYRGDLVVGETKFTEAGTGTLQLALVFQLANNGPKRTVFLPLTENTLGRDGDKPRMATRVLEQLGYDGNDPPTFSAPIKNVELYMKHDQFNGETNEKWQVSGGMQLKDAGTDRINRFKADWRATSGGKKAPPAGKSNPPPSTKPSGPPPESGPPADTGEDIQKWAAKDKGEAWAIWERESSNGTPNTQKWHESVREVGKGRSEKQFTADDWTEVAKKAIPF